MRESPFFSLFFARRPAKVAVMRQETDSLRKSNTSTAGFCENVVESDSHYPPSGRVLFFLRARMEPS
jgi:hypothetical protein